MSLSIMGNVDVIPVEELHHLPDPEPMGPRHKPISHIDLIQLGRKAFNVNELDITNIVPRLSTDRKKMICTFDVVLLGDPDGTPKWQDDIQKLIGIFSNFQNQTGVVTMGAGPHVFACTNEMIDAEFKVRHKSTKNLEHNIRNMIWDKVPMFDGIFEAMTGRQKYWSEMPITEEQAAYHIIDGMKRGVINSRELPRVVEYWEDPEHKEFKTRNYWSLFNAFSGFFQDRNPFDISDRSAKLNRQFDDIYAGIQEEHWETTSEYERLCSDADLEVHKDLEGYES